MATGRSAENGTTNAEPIQSSVARRAVRFCCLFLVVPYLGIVVLFALGQRQLLYAPQSSAPLTAAQCGLDASAARDVTIQTDDGILLHGWLLNGLSPVARDSETPDAAGETNPLVLYFPGNASHRAGRINDLCDFTRLGCDVLIFDYRGYAENDGSPSEAAMTADARRIWEFAVGALETAPREVILFGESMGGAVAIHLASSLCRQGTPPAALVTNATFDSVPSLSTYHYPLFPFRWLVWDRWPSIERIDEVTCPILMFHGAADSLIPIQHGQRLFRAAPAQSVDGIPNRFVAISGAGHNDIPIARLEEELRRLLSSLAETVPAAN